MKKGQTQPGSAHDRIGIRVTWAEGARVALVAHARGLTRAEYARRALLHSLDEDERRAARCRTHEDERDST